MARIAGVDLPRRKAIAYALPYIYASALYGAFDLQGSEHPESRKVDELSESTSRLSATPSTPRSRSKATRAAKCSRASSV